MATYLPILILIGMLLLGVPIAISLAASGMIGLWIVSGDINRVIGLVSLSPFSTVAVYDLTTIPMFILMARAVRGSRSCHCPSGRWIRRCQRSYARKA